jgi:hypothetical protein
MLINKQFVLAMFPFILYGSAGCGEKSGYRVLSGEKYYIIYLDEQENYKIKQSKGMKSYLCYFFILNVTDQIH